MSKFIQFHILTPYPLSNVNRDDLGRPKTTFSGGTERGRISSQSLKRAWRTSSVFEDFSLGSRSKVTGIQIQNKLMEEGFDEETVRKALVPLLKVFGGLEEKKDPTKKTTKEKKTQEDKDLTVEFSQLVFLSQAEIEAIQSLARTLISEDRKATSKEIKSLKELATDVDIAMFGRMMASDITLNVDAAVQVAHAVTVSPAKIESDYFTSVDDLAEGLEIQGSAFLGERGMTSGIYYSYVCIDKDDLIKSLKGNKTLATQAVKALLQAALTITPSGMQNSFASRTYANYCQIETGSAQPRTLSPAFLSALPASATVEDAVKTLETYQGNLDKAFNTNNVKKTMDIGKGVGSFLDLIDFIEEM